MANASPPVSEPTLRLQAASAGLRHFCIFDTNILNAAITSPAGAVLQRLNDGLVAYGIESSRLAGFCMTPFQLIEILGTDIPRCPVVSSASKGQTAGDVVGVVVDAALEFYAALPQLARPALQARIDDRRSYLPPEGKALFDICAQSPLRQDSITRHIASALAWDHALKIVYPTRIADEVNHFFASLLLVNEISNISRFRIAKRLWDRFFSNATVYAPPEARAGIDAANHAMRLKTSRDFLDCDLIHLACFGWFGDDVIALTSDPPDTVLNRIAVYKGMVEAAAAMAPTIEVKDLPPVRAGAVVRCDFEGTVTHLFPVQLVPTIL